MKRTVEPSFFCRTDGLSGTTFMAISFDFPYVRVDLYSVDGKVYFGELTFYPWSGYVQYTPDEADFWFGKDFVLKEYS